MNVFLKWLYKSDLMIHYVVVNLFYFSIVDIVDSAIVNSKISGELDLHFAEIHRDASVVLWHGVIRRTKRPCVLFCQVDR